MIDGCVPLYGVTDSIRACIGPFSSGYLSESR